MGGESWSRVKVLAEQSHVLCSMVWLTDPRFRFEAGLNRATVYGLGCGRVNQVLWERGG